MRRFKLIFFFCLLNYAFPFRAQSVDSVQLSLLTCEPGAEIYAHFGHTAIRYQNFTRQLDYVFNYGMFSFNTPHFIYRFVKGETDYELGVTSYDYFAAEYAARGSSVYQQVLNLNPVEKQHLIDLLQANYLPQNRVYRYNFFYDNCSTRARDKIEEAISGKVVYPLFDEDKSFRQIVHEFTQSYDWDELGIDLCLGKEADIPIKTRLQMFAPFYLRKAFAKAVIVENGQHRPLVLSETKIVDAVPSPVAKGFPLSPFVCSLCVALCLTLASVWQYCQRQIYWVVDGLFYGLKALSGIVIAFLFFFSSHPTVGSNWLLLLFNPLPLLWLPCVWLVSSKRFKCLIWLLILTVLTLFIFIMAFSSQKFNLSVLPLALGFWLNALSHVLVIKKHER